MLRVRHLPLLVLATLLLAPAPARAYIFSENGRIDYLLYAPHDPKLVVVGRVTEFKLPPPPPTSIADDLNLSFDMTFHIDAVLFGTHKEDTLRLHSFPFLWPAELVPQKSGAYCILILRPEDGSYSIGAVVPAKPGTFAAAKDYAALTLVIAQQILAQLADEKDVARQWELLRQVAPILARDQVPAVEPFLTSKNIWIRRAALGAITWATLDPTRIAEVQSDLADFAEKTKPGDSVPDLKPGIGYSAYALVTQAYFFLNCNWSPEENARKAPLLPVFRQIAGQARLSPSCRWTYGFDPLCRIGTAADARTLWDCYTTTDETFRKEIFRSASYRQALLMALSRIYDLKLLNWVEDDFVRKEASQAQTVRQALVEQQVIKN